MSNALRMFANRSAARLYAACILLTSLAASASTLTGAYSTAGGNYNLSNYGTQDWMHVGDGSVPGYVRKNPSPSLITTYSSIGGGTVVATTSGSRNMTWSGGSPVATASGNRNGVAVSGVGKGFSLTVPADAQARTIRLNVGGINSGATFRATMSDGSVADYVQSVALSAPAYNAQFTVNYSANGPGRTLTLTWTQDSGAGQVFLHAAAAPTFTYVNFAPTLSAPATVSAQVSQPASASVVGVDANGDPLTYAASGLPPGLSINTATGQITGSPSSVGSYTASVSVTDSGGLSANGNISFTVLPGSGSNTTPSAATGSFATPYQTSVSFTPTWVDPDSGDSWTVAVLVQPTNGTASASGTQITYTPNAGYTGPDSFTFRVVDALGAFTDGTASGTVTSVFPAQVAGLVATSGTVFGGVNLSWGVASNSTSYDVRRGLTSSDPSPVLLGNTTNTNFTDSSASAGVLYYYSIVGRNGSTPGPASVTVSGYADTAPSAAVATFAAVLQTPLDVFPSFTDPDPGDTATYAVLSQPTSGTAVVVGNKFVYTPATGFVGTDSFQFTVTDRAGASVTGVASGTVTAVAPSPVATLSASQGLLADAVQVDWTAAPNALSYRVLRGASAGDPSPANLGTVTSLTFTDSSAAPGIQYYYSVQSLTVGQQAVPSPSVLGFADTPPSGAVASFSTPVDTAVIVAPSFTDPDAGETFTYAVIAQPANGVVTVSSSQITYRPNPGYVGADSFSFRVTDRAGQSAVGTATGSVYSVTPHLVPGIVATQASLIDAVDVAWTAALNATSYSVYRSLIANDPNPQLLQTVGALTYRDSTAQAGQTYYYYVRGTNIYASGGIGSGVSGFANTVPSSLTASFSTLQGQSVFVLPSWQDTDPAETFTVAIVQPPTNGTTQVIGTQIRYTPHSNYIGPEAFQWSVTDRAGSTVLATATGSVNPGIPEAPPDFSVTQGTLLGSIQLVWTPTLGSLNYLVLRSETASNPAPETIATVEGSTFSDTNVVPGATYYYRIRAAGASGNSQPSQQVSGYADTPPSAASATASTVYNIPVDFAPVVVDQDPLDTHVLTILTQPSNGTVTLNAERTRFIYTPSIGFAGLDNFTFAAADVAAASVNGTATVAVGCPAPNVAALQLSQPKIFAGSGFKVTTSYGNTACPTSLSARFELKSGTTLVYGADMPALSGVVSAPIEFPVEALQAGTYLLSVAVTDATTGNVTTSSVNLSVSGYRMPTFTATSTLFADIDSATIAVGSSTDCTLTSDRASAIANHALCYYEVVPIPPGLAMSQTTSFPTWTGKVSVAGTYQPVLSVYQYDDFGTAKLVGSQQRSMVVQPVTSMTFSSPASVTVAQYMEEGVVNVSQTAGNPCLLTTNRQSAMTAASAGTRSCYLEFSTVTQHQTLLGTGVKSPYLTAGTSAVNWTVSTFDVAGNQIPFTSGSTDVVVVPPDVSYVASTGTQTPIATITNASVRLNSTGSRECFLTTNLAMANVPGITKPCLVEWTSIPEGLSQPTSVTTPQLEGVFLTTGQKPISFDVSYYDVTGVKRLLWSATTPVYVEAPPMPEVILRAGKIVGTDIYSVPVVGGSVANLLVDVTKWPVDVSVKWSDETVARTYRVSPTRNMQVIDASPAPLWTRRSATIRLFLRESPALFVEKTIEVVSTPVTSVMLDLDALQPTVPDSQPTSMTARVYTRSAVGPIYDAPTIGNWKVTFGTKDALGRFVPSGDPVSTNNLGLASSTLDPFGILTLRAVAQAVPESPYPDVQLPPILSPLRVATVVKGTSIDGSVKIMGLTEGPAPFVGIFRAMFDTRADQVANLSVTWSVSEDNGSTWTKLDIAGIQVVKRFGEGKFLVKAHFVNRNTGADSESEPVALAVWAVPKITFSGPRFAFPGSPVAVDIKLTHPNGEVVQSGTVEWSIKRRVVLSSGAEPPPPLATGNDQQPTFTASEPGMYFIYARARMNSSNPDNPKSWGVSQYQVAYGAPEKPFGTLTTPFRAEVGKEYKFDVLVRTRFDINATVLKLGGRWVMPDGTVIDGLGTATYTPTVADLDKAAFVTVKHESWIVGYEDTTTAVVIKSIPIWKYVWPDWRLVTSVATTAAPTGLRVTVLPSDLRLLPTLEGLTYTWTLPSTMRAITPPASKLDAIVDFGGTHPISLVVSDARGNSFPLETSITVADPKPYVLDLAVTNQSKWTHAPLQVGLIARTTGGHPLDGIVEWKYFVNGTALDIANKNSVSVPLQMPGTYNVEARVSSRMGATASKQVTVNVPDNVPPTCTLAGVPSLNRAYVALTVTCKDTDGAITRYEWSVNGVQVPFGPAAKWTYNVPASATWPLAFDVQITDDGGAKITSSVTVN